MFPLFIDHITTKHATLIMNIKHIDISHARTCIYTYHTYAQRYTVIQCPGHTMHDDTHIDDINHTCAALKPYILIKTCTTRMCYTTDLTTLHTLCTAAVICMHVISVVMRAYMNAL